MENGAGSGAVKHPEGVPVPEDPPEPPAVTMPSGIR